MKRCQDPFLGACRSALEFVVPGVWVRGKVGAAPLQPQSHLRRYADHARRIRARMNPRVGNGIGIIRFVRARRVSKLNRECRSMGC